MSDLAQAISIVLKHLDGYVGPIRKLHPSNPEPYSVVIDGHIPLAREDAQRLANLWDEELPEGTSNHD